MEGIPGTAQCGEDAVDRVIRIIKGETSTRRVWIDGKELSPVKSQAVMNHSPDGFAWGYGGSGPSQLALAICLELFLEREAERRYQSFKWDVISHLPMNEDFEIILILQNYRLVAVTMGGIPVFPRKGDPK